MRPIDQDSLKAIAEREGLRLTAYKDQGGTWTIGYGRAHGVKEGDICTQPQALAWLQEDVAEAETDVSEAIKVILSDNQYGALVSFDFNVGHGKKGLRDGFVELRNGQPSTLLRTVNAGLFANVPSEMLKWVKVNGVKDDGLVNRRNSEGGQWVKGAYVRGAAITPDAPLPSWKTALSTLHLKLKAAGTTIAGLGIGGAQLKDVGTQFQSYATAWHSLATVGIALCVLGVILEVFHKAES